MLTRADVSPVLGESQAGSEATSAEAPEARAPVVVLTDATLHDLARELAPLARLDLAAGYRSLHPDPDHVRGGRAPEMSALERAAECGDLAKARAVWRRVMQCPAEERRTLAWVAEAAGAAVSVEAWSVAVAVALGPGELVDRARKLEAMRERAKVVRVAMTRAVTRGRGMTAEDSERLAKATRDLAAIELSESHVAEVLHQEGYSRLWLALGAWLRSAPGTPT